MYILHIDTHSKCFKGRTVESPLCKQCVALTVPAEHSVEGCILLRVEVFCSNNHWKMSDLEGKGGKKQFACYTHEWEAVRAACWRHVDRDLRCNTVPCLVRWVPGPQLLWCSTTFDRTDRTQRCESRCRPGSGSTFWAEPASGPSSQRGSTTPTACLRSHLSLRRPHSCSNIYPKPATKLYWTVMDVMPCRLAWHGHNGVMWHPLSPRRRVRLNYHEHEGRKRTEDEITLTD